MHKCLLAVLWAVCSFFSLRAQPAVSIYVTDAQTRLPLAGALIFNKTNPAQKGYSDDSGRLIWPFGCGDTLVIESIGISQSFLLPCGKSEYLLALVSAAKQLAPVTVGNHAVEWEKVTISPYIKGTRRGTITGLSPQTEYLVYIPDSSFCEVQLQRVRIPLRRTAQLIHWRDHYYLRSDKQLNSRVTVTLYATSHRYMDDTVALPGLTKTFDLRNRDQTIALDFSDQPVYMARQPLLVKLELHGPPPGMDSCWAVPGLEITRTDKWPVYIKFRDKLFNASTLANPTVKPLVPAMMFDVVYQRCR